MKIHSGAKTCPSSRVLLVRRVLEEGRERREVARSLGVSLRTVQKWLSRYRLEGPEGLWDRASTPRSPARRWSERMVGRVIELRRMGLSAVMISRTCPVPRSTVGRILRKHRLSRRRDLEPPRPPPRRYEHASPGELLHVDTKRLGRIGRVGHRIHGDRTTRVRGIGWETVHVAIDDATRVAYVEVLPDEQTPTVVGFLERARAWYAVRGVTVIGLMTDNGSAYRSHAVRACLAGHAIRHLRTRPYTPRTNGKAERLIQTLLREWAYERPYRSSAARAAALPDWQQYYNTQRPHTALHFKAPRQRL